jgi:hypothetical protein
MFPQQQDNAAIMEDMFSTQTVRGLLGFIRCELLLLEAIN